MAFSRATAPGGSDPVFVVPGGRLTLTTGVAVLTTEVLAAATIYYTPYLHDLVPYFDGSKWFTGEPGEVSLALDSTNALSGKSHDVFFFNDSGTRRTGYGPAWSTDTARGTGAGTTELQRLNGVLTNKVTITLRYSSIATVSVSANQATYLGTFRASANGQTQFSFGGSPSAGGTEAKFYLWNMYNRVSAVGLGRNSNDSWTYSAVAWRSADGSDTMRCSMVRGMDEDAVEAKYHGACLTGAGVFGSTGIGVDSTTAFSGVTGSDLVAPVRQSCIGAWSGLPGLGFHFIQAIEHVDSVAGATFYGDLNLAYVQTGLIVRGKF